MIQRPAIALAALLVAALGVFPCHASTYVVSPVSMTLSAGEPQGAFRLANEDNHPIRIEIAVKDWSQVHNQEVEQDSTDLIVSPKIVVVPPHSMQVVRVGLRDTAAPSTERSYRLVFQDLADPVEAPPAPGETRVDYSVPVFVTSNAPAGSKLEFTLKKSDASVLMLTITNHGDVHEKIILLDVTRRTTGSTPADGILDAMDMNTRHYVLAGVTRDFALHLRSRVAQGEGLSLDMLVGARHVQIPITVQ